MEDGKSFVGKCYRRKDLVVEAALDSWNSKAANSDSCFVDDDVDVVVEDGSFLDDHTAGRAANVMVSCQQQNEMPGM